MGVDTAVERRAFLQGAALGAVGLGVGSVVANSAWAGGTRDATPIEGGTANYEVVNCDLLVIGGGLGAMAVAQRAIEQGKHVVMVDKGPFRHSGGSGYNWDCIGTWVPSKDEWHLTNYMNRTNNTELHHKIIEEYPVEDEALMYLRRGQVLPFREEDGGLTYKCAIPGIHCAEGVMFRLFADDLLDSPLLTVADQTMVTDLFVNDGRCLGAVAMHIPTGDVRVYRANATVNCTGPTAWIYGWKTVSAYTISSPDNTGDVDMAAFRHGAHIGENEAMGFDFSTTYPEGFSFGWGSCLVPDAMEWPAFTDRNGKPIFTQEVMDQYGYTPELFTSSRPVFNRFLAELKINGEFEAMDDGSIACDMSDFEARPCMQENIKFFDKIGVAMTSGPVAVHEESYERGGTPTIDDNLMCEDIEGIFFPRGVGASNGLSGGSYSAVLFRNGNYVANRALEYMEKTPAPEAIDWSPAEAECCRLHEIRTRSAEDGIRPHAVRHAIQKTCGECMGIVRTKEVLDAAIAEIERIRTEDMPRQTVVMKSPVWNREWKEAIENYNMLDAAELAVKAARMREETRGEYFYVDFPEPDPSWDAQNLLAHLEDDGTIAWEKRSIPQHELFMETVE